MSDFYELMCFMSVLTFHFSHGGMSLVIGINTLIDIMARMGFSRAKRSPIMNNERLEYLGDAVIEFLTSIHLYFMFPDDQEGSLASYRSTLVQNKHLALLAKVSYSIMMNYITHSVLVDLK